ncbi:MAG: hypothetical protein PHX08_05850 [Lachnospiraceae bacterium]|nr:hypothetical protein [Lachnospiraceae bacterium]
MYFYVAETSNPKSDDTFLKIKNEITEAELEILNSAFRVCSLYHSITQIKDIVVENGESFKRFMSIDNLKELSANKVPPERSITLANKVVLNYASSIKTYIDMETRLLINHSTKKELKMFEDICHQFYDEHLEYRFWVNFRNYIVHCEFPYSIYQESVENGCRLICTKDHLLKFDNWKHSKADIQKMDVEINLPTMVDHMSSLIYALYIDFFSHFGKEIIDGIDTYSEFCRKYSVKQPVIYKTHNRELTAGSHIQPLPVKELRAAFDILKSNPRVTINIKT